MKCSTRLAASSYLLSNFSVEANWQGRKSPHCRRKLLHPHIQIYLWSSKRMKHLNLLHLCSPFHLMIVTKVLILFWLKKKKILLFYFLFFLCITLSLNFSRNYFFPFNILMTIILSLNL